MPLTAESLRAVGIATDGTRQYTRTRGYKRGFTHVHSARGWCASTVPSRSSSTGYSSTSSSFCSRETRRRRSLLASRRGSSSEVYPVFWNVYVNSSYGDSGEVREYVGSEARELGRWCDAERYESKDARRGE